MISFDLQQHFNVNRLLLLGIGLWPYWQTKLARIQIILISGILTSFILLQFATFITAKCTLDLVINILSITLIFVIHLTKYSTFLIKIQNVKYLLNQLERICSKLRNKKEIAIIENNAVVMKRYIIIFSLLSISYLIMINLLPMWPRVLGIFLLINDTQPRRIMLIMNEYILDQERYFYVILLHTNATLCIGAFIVLAITAMIMGYLQHICGMFRIASYRIEQAMDINVLQNISPKDEMMICKKIVYAVDIHRKALSFSKITISTFEGMFFLLLVFGVSCMSLNLYRVFQIVTFEFNIEELTLHITFIFTILLYIFLINYAAQEVTNCNEHVFETAYNMRWYVTPIHIQKMILFLLQNGTKAFTLNLGGVFVGSLKSAFSLASTSVSYFTVLYSTAL
ncbi:odorant receptor 67c-like [Odontomachus brunneus]|uniref:odorant receptor 67c-like n=1 Tax=Odontomachus brunneus TaxID=486640 RepID=UPI0013F24A72|nr:odorant receptor 67c-like [Odontomachus brunneus]